MASKEFEFYVKADLSKYEGKYIVIIGDQIVASGDNAKNVLEEAKKKFPGKKPLLAKVPKSEALILYSTYERLVIVNAPVELKPLR